MGGRFWFAFFLLFLALHVLLLVCSETINQAPVCLWRVSCRERKLDQSAWLITKDGECLDSLKTQWTLLMAAKGQSDVEGAYFFCFARFRKSKYVDFLI